MSATLDVRHARDEVRVDAAATLRARAEEIAAGRHLRLSWHTRLDNTSVAVDPRLTTALESAVRASGLSVQRLPSGAGHDGVALAELTGIAMLFVRCGGGISHHPDERVEPGDAEIAVEVLADAVRSLGA